MTKQFLKFVDIEIEKKKFHSSKKAIGVNNVDVEKVFVCHEIVCGKNKEADAERFIEYQIGKKTRPLFIMLPQMSRYSYKAEKIQCMPFVINGEKLLYVDQLGIESATSSIKVFIANQFMVENICTLN